MSSTRPASVRRAPRHTLQKLLVPSACGCDTSWVNGVISVTTPEALPAVGVGSGGVDGGGGRSIGGGGNSFSEALVTKCASAMSHNVRDATYSIVTEALEPCRAPSSSV